MIDRFFDTHLRDTNQCLAKRDQFLYADCLCLYIRSLANHWLGIISIIGTLIKSTTIYWFHSNDKVGELFTLLSTHALIKLVYYPSEICKKYLQWYFHTICIKKQKNNKLKFQSSEGMHYIFFIMKCL